MRVARQALATGLALSGVLAVLTPAAAVAAFPGADGRIAYAVQTGPGGSSNLFSILPDRSGMHKLTHAPNFDTQPSWSADGRRLVFVRAPSEISTMDADGRDPRPVVTGVSPSFSPTGSRIAYRAGLAIRTIRVDGTDPRRLVTARDGALELPTYSPSGRRIAFVGRPKGRKRHGIWSMRPDGSRLRRLTNARRFFSDAYPDYSPDGRHIVFRRYGRRSGIYVMRADGSREHRITREGGSPTYAPAGNRIALVIAQGSSGFTLCSDIYTISRTGSDPQRVTEECPPGGGTGGLASSPTWQPLPRSP